MWWIDRDPGERTIWNKAAAWIHREPRERHICHQAMWWIEREPKRTPIWTKAAGGIHRRTKEEDLCSKAVWWIDREPKEKAILEENGFTLNLGNEASAKNCWRMSSPDYRGRMVLLCAWTFQMLRYLWEYQENVEIYYLVSAPSQTHSTETT